MGGKTLQATGPTSRGHATALRHPPGPAIDAAEDHDLDAFLRAGPSPSAAPFPPGLTTRLLAERGFWSLAPGVRADGFAVDDLRGTLSVEPGRLGAPGMFDAVVFTGLLSLWGSESRATPSRPAFATSSPFSG
jgi:hypothetical protein